MLLNNIRQLGFDPADVKYVINTHGHFDHAGGSALFQKVYGSRVVMTAEDWKIARAKPELAAFYMPTPQIDMVAKDGDTISLGNNTITLYHTPGHTEGVLSLGFTGKDGVDTHPILTLGGVGLNFPESNEPKLISTAIDDCNPCKMTSRSVYPTTNPWAACLTAETCWPDVKPDKRTPLWTRQG